MKNIIAKTILYRNDNGPKRFTITIYSPEIDPLPGGDYRCAVKITGDKIRYIYGIDSFQALNLAIYYVQVQAKLWLKEKTIFYFDKKLQQIYDVKYLILHDHSKFIKKAKKSLPNK